jgi:1-pyrroline-5-carboxylate dehydrogenase
MRLALAGKMNSRPSTRMLSSSLSSWATVDPTILGVECSYNVPNIVDGKWSFTSKSIDIPHPLKKDAPHALFTIPDTQVEELQPFLESLRKVPKSGMHNPLKNPHRYLEYGEISRKAAEIMSTPEGADFFAQTIIACVPKSYAQALGEVKVTCAFLKNFAGDNVRRLAKSFGVPGDHYGQMSVGHRYV